MATRITHTYSYTDTGLHTEAENEVSSYSSVIHADPEQKVQLCQKVLVENGLRQDVNVT